MWDLGVEGGTLVTRMGLIRANLYVQGEKLGAISVERQRSHRSLDARERLVLPGVIDTHLHSRDPGLTYKEDFDHATRAAAFGGVTTVLEMPNCLPPVTDLGSFEARRAHLLPQAHVDFGLWALALGDANLAELPRLAAAGACGFKLFWGYALDRRTLALVYNPAPDDDVVPPPDDAGLLRLMDAVQATGRPLAIHAEHRGLNAALIAGVDPDAPDTYAEFLRTRPALTEAVAVETACRLAQATGVALHIVHLTAADSVDVIRAARARGVDVTAETCPQYITLSDEDFPRVGPLMKVYPPVRTVADQSALRRGLADGTIAYVASDHAPHATHEKQGSLWTAPAGTPVVETMLPLFLRLVSQGVFTLEDVARLLSYAPARRFGLYPRKGALEPGSDADLVIVNPDHPWTIRAAAAHSKHPLSPWEGETVPMAVETTVVRGQVVVADGDLQTPGAGTFLRFGAPLS